MPVQTIKAQNGQAAIPVLFIRSKRRRVTNNRSSEKGDREMDRRRLLYSVALVVVLGLAIVVPASAECEPPCWPEPPCAGCTPGYWKQEHHFDSWEATGFAPTDTLSDAFGCELPDKTLIKALKAKGGHEKAFMRHAVAALLNAAHPDMTYGSVEGIKDNVCEFWGQEWYKNELEYWNETLPCLLD
jgi:hypothetical protein